MMIGKVYLSTELLVTFVAVISGAVGYLIRERRENKEKQRLLLYYLLEIRHRLRVQIFDSEKITKTYLMYLERSFKKVGILVSFSDCPKELVFVLSDLISEILKVKEKDLCEDFLNAVKEVARVDPVLAWIMNGQELMKDYIEQQNKGLQRWLDYDPSWKENSNIPCLKDFKEVTSQEIVKGVDKKILIVAKKCSWWTWLYCRRVFRKNHIVECPIRQNDVDEILKQLIKTNPGFFEMIKNDAKKRKVSDAPSS